MRGRRRGSRVKWIRLARVKIINFGISPGNALLKEPRADPQGNGWASGLQYLRASDQSGVNPGFGMI